MVERISVIVRGVKSMSYGGGERESFEIVKFKALMAETFVLVQGKAKGVGAELKLVDFSDFDIECQPVQISQVLINLISNSCDAIASLPDRWIQVNVLKTENVLQIAITDSGNGIPADAVDKLFTSFFTSKERGKGTGLGLSICRKIAESHHGTLVYQSQYPHTQFLFTLPVRQPKSDVPPHKESEVDVQAA